MLGFKNYLVGNVTTKFGRQQAFQIGAVSFLLSHVFFLTYFHIYNITIMERYNCFSVVFYAVIIVMIKTTKLTNSLVLMALLEYLVHFILGIYCLGWSVGFGQFMLVIIPVPFYLSFQKKIVPLILSIIDIITFISLKIACEFIRPIYTGLSDKSVLRLYLVNSALCFLMIIYVSTIYIIYKERIQNEMRVTNETLQKLATVDPLTELFNRRAMIDFMKIIEKNSLESKTSYVIGLGDIDDFKRINDTYGHDTGDEVLKMISSDIVTNVPSEGYVCRWGGEEILFVIPSANLEKGRQIAEKICSDISAHEFCIAGSKFNVSLTIGISESSENTNYENGINTADRRLYVGKHKGKNCVISCENV